MSKINKLLNDLIIDPEYNSLYYRFVIASPLDAIELKEDNKSNILAWLLNPAQGHLQGDYFLKVLINTVYQTTTKEQLEALPNGVSFNTFSLKNISVMRELVIKGGRIDLLLADIATKTIIVIERKDGSIAQRNQLEIYYEWVQEHYSDWHQFFILSDSHSRNHNEQAHPAYIQLDDSWLSQALLELINKDRLPRRLEYSFRDIHDFVFGEWDEKNDPFFKDFDALHKKIASRHNELLTNLQNNFVDVNGKHYPLCDINPYIYFSKIKPNQEQFSPDEMELFSCLQKNYEVINSLSNFTEFELFSDEVLNIYPDLESAIDSNSICFILKKHVTDEYDWSYYIKILRDDEDGEVIYNISFVATRYGNESTWHIAEKFAQLCEFKLKKNWKWREELIEENIKELSLDNKFISSAISDFFNKVKKLPNL